MDRRFIWAMALMTLIVMAPAAQDFLLPVTAGGFLYIALADLIPQLHEPSRLRQTLVQITLLAVGFFSVLIVKYH